MLFSAGDMHASIVVRELPPKEFYKILVSLESLYGMWSYFSFEVNADITCPKAKRLLFIFIPSFIIFPSAPVFFIFSEPAKSTKWNFAFMFSSIVVGLSEISSKFS